MQYLGGKYKVAKEISRILNSYRKDGQPYWEPFVGAAWIAQHMNGSSPNYFSDFRVELIALWQALLDGWTPPDEVSRQTYEAAQAGLLSPRLTAFIGFGCSYSGKWFGGYARSGSRNYASNARNSLLRKVLLLQQCRSTFFVANFLSASPPADDCLIYCDPPYRGVTSYDGLPRFDHDAFWDKCRQLHSQGHTVITSEYQAPPDFGVIWEQQVKTDMHKSAARKGGHIRTERLFMYNQEESK